MTACERYQDTIDLIFGVGTCRIPAQYASSTNNVLGALADPLEFDQFRDNFLARLRRLQRAYSGHPGWPSLLTQVAEVASPTGWQGAFSELAAFDCFNSTSDYLMAAPSIDVSIDASRALAGRFGRAKANLDVHIADFDLFTDVKVLKDNVSEILEGIYREVWPVRRPLVHHQFPNATFEALRDSRALVAAELRTSVEDQKKPRIVDLDAIVPGLRIHMEWERGVLVSHGTYSPFAHARETHRLPFLHVKKFVVDRPFFLTLVTFPWFNNVITDFAGANTIFYRALARRVFCQYRHDLTRFAAWEPEFAGEETVWEVSRYLGGILVLEDQSISGSKPSEANVRGHYYENPNALYSPSAGLAFDYLREVVDGRYDLFEHDNY